MLICFLWGRKWSSLAVRLLSGKETSRYDSSRERSITAAVREDEADAERKDRAERRHDTIHTLRMWIHDDRLFIYICIAEACLCVSDRVGYLADQGAVMLTAPQREKSALSVGFLGAPRRSEPFTGLALNSGTDAVVQTPDLPRTGMRNRNMRADGRRATRRNSKAYQTQ